MTPRGERISDLADTICRGKRHEAADRHVESLRTMPKFIDGAKMKNDPHYSFLAGWDAAMALRADELRDENQELHGMVIDLCARLCTKRCEACHGLGDDGSGDGCPHCDGGYVDAPPGESEQIVKDIRSKHA